MLNACAPNDEQTGVRSPHPAGVSALATDPLGAVLVTGDSAGSIRAFDFRTRKLLSQCDAGAGPVWSLALNQNRREIAIATCDGKIRIWDPALPVPDQELDARTRQVLFLQYGSAQTGLIWAGVEGRIVDQDQVIFQWNADLTTVAIDPTARWIALGGHLRNASLVNRQNQFAARRLEGHRRNVSSLAFNRDGTLLASGSADCAVRLWQTSSATPPLILEGHQAPVLSICFSPDGQSLASGDASGVVLLWNVEDGVQLAKFAIPLGSADCVVFGGQGKLLAAAGTGPEVHVWSLTKS